jgi:hypothetical protein
MNKRNLNATYITIIIFTLGIFLNLMIQILPENIKRYFNKIALVLGLSYSLFWLFCSLLIIFITLFFVWKQTITGFKVTNNEFKELDDEAQPIISKRNERKISQFGEKSIYIEKNKGDININ